MAELLEIEGLGVRYRALRGWQALLAPPERLHVDAVLDVSLSIQSGETYGLVGESGAGKTTLVRAIVGLTTASAGRIRLHGRVITHLSEQALRSARRQIGVMFQDPVASLSPRRTVASLVTEPFLIHRLRPPDLGIEARRLLGKVGLDPRFLNLYPHQLSGGQARRVGAARALALNPALIVADEPTAGLDVSVQGEILNLLTALKTQHGMGYLIVTHNLPVIRHISDRIGIMYLGRLVEEGSTRQVFRHPAHPYTAGLVAAIPQSDPELGRQAPPLEGEIPSLRHRPRGCEFHTRCQFANERCRNEAPVWRPLGGARSVRCHYPRL
jgi:oligopeptide/dipeptide ABC transporter ATP-binding protein